MNNIILEFLAFACVISSILVITSRNPVIAVIYLISVFINAACYLLMLGIGFIGLTYLLLYVGAITILFLFVIMSINIKLTDIMEAGTQYTQNIPLALSIGIFFIYELVSILPYSILRLGDSLGAYVSFLSYPIKAFKIFNDQLINVNDSSVQLVLPLASSRENAKTEIFPMAEDYPTAIGNISNNPLLQGNLTLDINTGLDSDTIINLPLPNGLIDAMISPLIQLSALAQELYTHGVS